jgi:hypothetical protein
MPLVRVSLRRGKPAATRKAILEGIYGAMAPCAQPSTCPRKIAS